MRVIAPLRPGFAFSQGQFVPHRTPAPLFMHPVDIDTTTLWRRRFTHCTGTRTRSPAWPSPAIMIWRSPAPPTGPSFFTPSAVVFNVFPFFLCVFFCYLIVFGWCDGVWRGGGCVLTHPTRSPSPPPFPPAFPLGSYIRTIYHPGGCPVTDLALASSGNLAVYSTADARIHIYTINGSHVVSSPRLPAPIEAMVFSRTGEYLVTGDRRGMLEVRAAHSLESMFRLPIHIRIRDIQVEPSERNVVVALDDGHIVVLSLFDEEVSLNNVVVGTESPELIS